MTITITIRPPRAGEITAPGEAPRRVEILPGHEPARTPAPAEPVHVPTPEREPVPA